MADRTVHVTLISLTGAAGRARYALCNQV